MIRQTDRFIIPAPSTDTVVRKKANSRGLCKRNFYGKLNRSLDAKFNGQRKQDWVTKSAVEATNAKQDRIRVIRGIDLDQLQTKTKRSTLSLERTGYSSSFDCELSTRFESIQVTTTNDYWTCEEWCEAIRRQKTKFLGMTLYHAFLSEPPPQPDPQYRPRSRYRKENSTKKPPPLPPGGPLLLREEGSVIVLMVLATEGQILLLQLRHMRVIGPNLRSFRSNRNKWSYETQESDLFVDFRFLESWDTIEKLVDDLGHEFNEYHATAVFARLRFVPRPDDVTFYSKLIDKTKLMVDGISAKHLMLILYSSLRLELPCADFQQMIATRLMQISSPLKVESSLLGNVMLALGLIKKRRLQSRQDAVVFPLEAQFAKHLVQCMERENRIDDFTEMECVRVLYMIAHMQSVLDPDPVLINTLCQKLSQPILISRLTELSNMALISSLASLRHNDHRLVDLVIKEMMKTRSLVFYRGSELAHMAFCLGTLQYWNREFFEMLFTQVLSEERRSQFTELNLINFLYSITKQKQEVRGFDKDRFIRPLLIEAGQPYRMENYLTVGITGILYNLGVIGYPGGQDSSILTPLVKELTSSSRLRGVTCQGLAMAFWGLGKVEFKDWKLLDAIADEVVKTDRLASFTDQGLSIIIYTCGALEYQNSNLMNTVLHEITKEGRLENLTSHDLCNLAFGLGRTSCANSKFARRIMKECIKEEKLTSMETHQVCNVLRMGSKLQVCQLNDLERLLRELTNANRFNTLRSIELQETLLAICSSRALVNSSHTVKLIKKSLEKEVLESFETCQLGALGMAISVSRGVHSLDKEEKTRFVQEVTSDWRIQQFNPIDITNLYTTILCIGIQEETPLKKLMAAINEKPFDRRRKASQFRAVLASTAQIENLSLKSELFGEFLGHLNRSESMKVFDAAEAFGVLTLLVKFQISPQLNESWTTALHNYTSLAKSGDLSNTSDHHFYTLLEDAIALEDKIPQDIPIGVLILSMFNEKKAWHLTTKALVRCITKVALMRLATSKQQRSEVLHILMMVLQKKERLCSIPSKIALHLLQVLEDYDALPAEMREELVRASYSSSVSNRNQTVAFALERMTGCYENE
eukprot:g4819.t1